MTRGTTRDPWPDEPDDEFPDFLWPDDDDSRDDHWAGRPEASGAGARWSGAVSPEWAPPAPEFARGARERRRRILALSVTAVVALGLGAGAVYAYRNAEDSTTPAASASTSPAPGHSGGSGSQGVTTEMELVGKVTALGPGTITFAAWSMFATGPSVKAAVTSATRFTGSVRTLAAVRVGDIVAAQILISGDAARVVTLQDPASES
jgi:hypothetical protein